MKTYMGLKPHSRVYSEPVQKVFGESGKDRDPKIKLYHGLIFRSNSKFAL